MPYAFFTSYARADNGRKALLRGVVDDLTERVRSRLGYSQEELSTICFFDETNVQTGQVWEQVLASAVNEAQVLVCFCSPTFFARPHCAKEFGVFQQRLERSAARPARILPVIWEPVQPWPAVIDAYQRKHAALPDKYQQHGLRKLKELRRAALTETLDALADRIFEMLRDNMVLVPLEPPPRFAELPEAFDNPDSEHTDVVVVPLHPLGAGWRVDPYGLPLYQELDEVFRKDRWTWRVVTAGEWAGYAQRLSSANNEAAPGVGSRPAVIVIADQRHTGADPLAASVMAAIDGLDRAYMVVGSQPDGPQPDSNWLTFTLNPPNPKQMRQLVEQMLARIRVGNSAEGVGGRRIVDAEAEAEAEARGIGLGSPPALQGPGST